MLASAIASPWLLVRWLVVDLVLLRVLLPLARPLLELLGNVLAQLFKLACQAPLLSIPLVLAGNVYLLWLCRELPAVTDALAPLVSSVSGALGSLQSASFSRSVQTDTTFALLLLGALQVATFNVVTLSSLGVLTSVPTAGRARSSRRSGFAYTLSVGIAPRFSRC